ncbi:MAG TPA: potassium channel family protein [Acidimicrobiia bacterium]
MIAFFVVFRKLFTSLRSGLRDPVFRGLLQLTGVLLLAGTFFYARVEGWTLLNSLYFSVMTLTTVGYGDFIPHTMAGRLFSIFYVLIGLGIVIALATEIAGHAARKPTAS